MQFLNEVTKIELGAMFDFMNGIRKKSIKYFYLGSPICCKQPSKIEL